MSRIARAIETAKQTGLLDLSGNQLTSLPAEIGKLTNMTRLDLNGNQLTSLPAEIGVLTKLWQLDLSGNQLTSLPAEIGELTNLKELNLRGNHLPDSIVELCDRSINDLFAYLRSTSVDAQPSLLTKIKRWLTMLSH